MTQDKIIEMARQANFKMENSAAIQAAEAFAKLVVAKDREQSSKVGDYNRGWNDCLFASGIVKQSQRTWQGLTDEERSQLVTLCHGWNEYGQVIEAKLKEKNT